jgi:hypothetical protein
MVPYHWMTGWTLTSMACSDAIRMIVRAVWNHVVHSWSHWVMFCWFGKPSYIPKSSFWQLKQNIPPSAPVFELCYLPWPDTWSNHCDWCQSKSPCDSPLLSLSRQSCFTATCNPTENHKSDKELSREISLPYAGSSSGSFKDGRWKEEWKMNCELVLRKTKSCLNWPHRTRL